MRKQYQASITVEAAFLFPLVLIVIVTVLLMALYVSDVAGTRAIVQEYSMVKTERSQSAEEMASVLEREIRSSLLTAALSDVRIVEKNGRRKIEVTLQMEIGFFRISMRDIIKEEGSIESNRQCLVKEKVIMDMISDNVSGTE